MSIGTDTNINTSSFHTLNDSSTRKILTKHISKTITVLAQQFFFTFACILLTTYVPRIQYVMFKYFVSISIFSIIGSLVTVIVLIFSYQKNIVHLGLFTIFESLLVCLISLQFSQDIVLMGLLLTIGLVTGLSTYALTTNYDYSVFGPELLSMLTTLCVVGITNIFLQIPILHVFGTYAGILVFVGYVIYDVQLFLTEKCLKFSSVDDDLYIDAALNIYLDVINILIRVWEILAVIFDDKKSRRK
jgi:FtsH-binding integral membrane protein